MRSNTTFDRAPSGINNHQLGKRSDAPSFAGRSPLRSFRTLPSRRRLDGTFAPRRIPLPSVPTSTPFFHHASTTYSPLSSSICRQSPRTPRGQRAAAPAASTSANAPQTSCGMDSLLPATTTRARAESIFTRARRRFESYAGRILFPARLSAYEQCFEDPPDRRRLAGNSYAKAPPRRAHRLPRSR